MFFKRLHVHGFKSFAHKTEIAIKPGITIIVGPNGCGKSNVFDSIQWALGEQSAKTLRGHRMGDVIFAGSSSQKAGSASEVTLDISNAGGFLPMDATELEITRRLHRSGESEYLLNGRPCRLKDIQRLIMGTGLGQNSYAVMQQGRIEAIINARPDSRRFIVEEAAGISKYKAQKEEAVRRLDRTDEDLHRITDLINEVKRNAGKLRKQAERAKQYQGLAERLRTYDMVLLARRYTEIVEEQTAAQDEYLDLETRLGALDARLEELQAQSDSGRDEMQELMALLEAAQTSQQELTRERDETDARVKVLEERLTNIAQRRERLQIEVETLSGQSSGQSAEAETLRQEQEKLRVEIREGELALERRTASLEGMREGATEQEQELASVRESMSALHADRTQLEGEIRFARQMLDTLQNKMGSGDQKLADLEAEWKKSAEEMEEARQGAFGTRDEYEQVAEKLKEKKEMLGKAEARQKDLQKRHGEVMNALRDARSRLGALQQLQENYDGFVRGVKEVMKAADDGKLPGVVGVVANLVRPHDKCERAIEVALGGAVQNIIVETAEDGKECINFLKRKDVGRATFLPLDTVRGRPDSPDFRQIMKLPGVVGFATELVDYDPHIREAVQLLLGNTVVVEHLDVALLLQKKGLRTKYVTLDGDLINPTGAMTGGSFRASGVLSREGEINSLVEATEELARQLVELDADIDRLESSIANYRQSIAELSERDKQLQIALASSVKDAQTLENAAKEKQQRYEQFKEEFENAEDERTAYEDQIRINGEVLEDLRQQIEDLGRRAEELTKQQGSRGQTINEMANAIQELRIGLAQKRERMSANERTIERLINESSRQTDHLDTKKSELTQLDEDEAAAKAEIEELRERLAELVERHTKLEGEVKAQSADRQERVDALQRLIEEQQSAQRERNILQNELQEADVKRAQKATQLESLNAQAEEKFESSLESVMSALEAELSAMAEARAAESETPEGAEAQGGAPQEAQVIAMEFGGTEEAGWDAAPVAAGGGAEAIPAPDAPQTAAQRARWLDHPLAQLPLESLQSEAADLRSQIEALGPVNMMAIDEYERIEERLGFMGRQQKDLVSARDTILKTIQKIDETTTRMFRECFDTVREYFVENFRRLFGGGKADLILTQPDDLLTTGIEIVAQPPGKKPQVITLLSGGEKCLTAIALMFALFQWKPSPFCVLDEIDAPLDDANVERFKAMIREFSEHTQFIIITHNKLTMELADTLFGITMEEPGVSKVVSVRFDELEESGLIDDAPPEAAQAAQAG